MVEKVIVIPGKPIELKRHRTLARDRFGRPLKKQRQYDPQKKIKESFGLLVRSMWNHYPIAIPILVGFEFIYDMPKKPIQLYGNSIKIKEWDRKPTKPDLSNLVKFAEDALNGILWKDDVLIVGYLGTTGKYYGPEEGTIITIREVL